MRLFKILIFRFFFENFLLSPKGPLQFFNILRASSVQFLGFLGTVEENTWHFEVPVLFLSLRYGAGLCRSRLVLYFSAWENYHGKQCVMENAFPFIAKYISNYTSLALLTFHPGASICKRFFMEFFPDDIFHMKHSDLKEIESTEQIEVRN